MLILQLEVFQKLNIRPGVQPDCQSEVLSRESARESGKQKSAAPGISTQEKSAGTKAIKKMRSTIKHSSLQRYAMELVQIFKAYVQFLSTPFQKYSHGPMLFL
jgi:hypothetical protein